MECKLTKQWSYFNQFFVTPLNVVCLLGKFIKCVLTDQVQAGNYMIHHIVRIWHEVIQCCSKFHITPSIRSLQMLTFMYPLICLYKIYINCNTKAVCCMKDKVHKKVTRAGQKEINCFCSPLLRKNLSKSRF